MKSYRTVFFLVIFALAFSIQCAEDVADDVEPQMSNQEFVENNLLPAVIIKGEESAALTLAGQMETHGVPGVAVAVIDGGEVAWVKGYGVVGEGGRAVDGDTLFRATQMSQLVTAVAVLRLVEEGKLDLDEDINERLIGWQFPENEFTVTEKVILRRILSHTAGIPYMYFRFYSPGDEVPNLLQVLKGEAPATNPAVGVVAEPGSVQVQSNAGYAALGLLIEETTSKGFQRIMRETVLKPVGMGRSFFAQALPEGETNAALGHNDTGAVRGTIHPELAALGLWTTANDLARLIIEIQESYAGKANHVLTQEMTRLMLTRKMDTWGLGVEVHGEGEEMYFTIEGHGSLYLCRVVGFPALGKGAVVLTNASAGEIVTSKVVRAIAKAYDWPAFQPREVEAMELSDAEIANIEGTYTREGRDFSYELGAMDGGLFLLRENREPKRLYRLSKDVLIESEFGIEYHLERDEAGEATGITLYINGRRGFTMIRSE